VDKEAALIVSWIRKAFCAIRCLARVADHCARM
jgi:hypothetical protein